ncbi:MAG: Uma2 family endonuclease [Fimbriimonadales bacterium]
MEPRCEYEHGRIIPMASPTHRHNDIMAMLYAHLRQYARQMQAGTVAMEVDVALPTGVGFIPDLSFIRREREREVLTPTGKIRGVPDLVVEVLSPSSRTRDSVHKLRAYHEAGVPWYWLVDSESLTLHEFQHTPEGYLLRTTAEGGEIFQSKALDGFTLDLKALIDEG